jgi:hypothetical protein
MPSAQRPVSRPDLLIPMSILQRDAPTIS